MKWDDIQTRALKDGMLVYALDQGQTAQAKVMGRSFEDGKFVDVREPGPWGRSQGGYCSGLSARWIALHYVGADYPYDPVTHECEAPDWQATRDHNLQVDDHEKGFPGKYKRVLAQYGLTMNKGSLRYFKGFQPSALVQAVNDFRGCMLLSMWGKDGGHGTAIGRRPEYKAAWFFFDPNYGEFTFPGATEARRFLEGFFIDTGYRNQFTASGVVGVNAPPYVLGDLKELTRLGWKLE